MNSKALVTQKTPDKGGQQMRPNRLMRKCDRCTSVADQENKVVRQSADTSRDARNLTNSVTSMLPGEKESINHGSAIRVDFFQIPVQIQAKLAINERRAKEKREFEKAFWSGRDHFGLRSMDIPGLKREEPILQQKESTEEPTFQTALPIVNEVLQSRSHPLDAQTRAFFEPRFGRDFSQVRIHTDKIAAESAKAVNSSAYTVGEHIVFGAGQYAPGTQTGRRLAAHELAHIIQQKRGNANVGADLARGGDLDTTEREAEWAAFQIARGASVDRMVETASWIQRAPTDGAPPDPLAPVQRVLDTVFRHLNGPATGYTIHACDDSTIVKSGVNETKVGRLAKYEGGAYVDGPMTKIWVHESTVRQGGVTREWGSELNLRQTIAHEVGHVLQGGGTCAEASRRGARLPGLTAAERLELSRDAAQIARVEPGARAAASRKPQPANRPPATKTTPTPAESPETPAPPIPATEAPAGGAGRPQLPKPQELAGEPGRAETQTAVVGTALMIHQAQISFLQRAEEQRALDAIAAITPEIEQRRSRGRWVAVGVVVSAPASVDLLSQIFTEPTQIIIFSHVMLTDGATRSEAENPPARLEAAPPRTESVRVLPPDPGPGRVFRSKIVEIYPPYERETPTPLVSRLVRLQNPPLAERYERMILALSGAPDPKLLERPLLRSYFAPYNLDNASVRNDIRKLIAATLPTREELMVIAQALGKWVF